MCWISAPTIFRASWYSLSSPQWGFNKCRNFAIRLCSRTHMVCMAIKAAKKVEVKNYLLITFSTFTTVKPSQSVNLGLCKLENEFIKGNYICRKRDNWELPRTELSGCYNEISSLNFSVTVVQVVICIGNYIQFLAMIAKC